MMMKIYDNVSEKTIHSQKTCDSRKTEMFLTKKGRKNTKNNMFNRFKIYPYELTIIHRLRFVTGRCLGRLNLRLRDFLIHYTHLLTKLLYSTYETVFVCHSHIFVAMGYQFVLSASLPKTADVGPGHGN